MKETPKGPSNIDPNDEHIHRVRTIELARYKAGVCSSVTAICGKRWEPNLPFTGNMREYPKCGACFPPIEHRFSLAV